jgi:hypothetical protein
VAAIVIATIGKSLVRTTKDSIFSEFVKEPTHAYANQWYLDSSAGSIRLPVAPNIAKEFDKDSKYGTSE